MEKSKENSKHEHDEEHEHQNPFANLDEETQRQIQEIQILEQNLQQILMQKQAFQMELNETDFAVEELKTSEGDVFKIVGGQVMIKTSKEKLQKDLEHKKDLINLRLKNIEKQEEEFARVIDKLREEILKKINR